MFVKQLSVFLANTPGTAEKFARLMGENNLDMLAATIADTTDFGILRTIVKDCDKALAVLKDANYAVSLIDVLAVAVPDCAGGLAKVLEVFGKSNVNVEYFYSFVRGINGSSCVILFRVDDAQRAAEALTQAGIRLVSQDELG